MIQEGANAPVCMTAQKTKRKIPPQFTTPSHIHKLPSQVESIDKCMPSCGFLCSKKKSLFMQGPVIDTARERLRQVLNRPQSSDGTEILCDVNLYSEACLLEIGLCSSLHKFSAAK